MYFDQTNQKSRSQTPIISSQSSNAQHDRAVLSSCNCVSPLPDESAIIDMVWNDQNLETTKTHYKFWDIYFYTPQV